MTDRTDPADRPQGKEPEGPPVPAASSTSSAAWPVWGATSGAGRPQPSDETPGTTSDETRSETRSETPGEALPADQSAETVAEPSDDAAAPDQAAAPDEMPATGAVPVADETDDAPVAEASDAVSVADESDDAPVADEADKAPAAGKTDEAAAADKTDEAPAADGADETPAADGADETPATDGADETPATDESVEVPAEERGAQDGRSPAEVPGADEAPARDEPRDGVDDSTRQVPVTSTTASADLDEPRGDTADREGASTLPTDDAEPTDGAEPSDESATETRALPTPAAAARAQAVSVREPDAARDAATTVLPPLDESADGRTTAPSAAAPSAAVASAAAASAAASAAAGAPVRTSAMPGRNAPSPDPAAPTPAASAEPAPTAATSAGPAGPAVAQPAPAGPGAPVPPALAGSSKVTGGPVPQARRESPLDSFEEEEPPVRRWPRRLLIGAATLVVLGGAYVGACYATADRVPRGTTVAGVDVGGLTEEEAVARLDDELASTLDSPVDVVAQEVQATIDPVEAGLGFDAQATVEGLTGVDLADPSRLWHQVVGVADREPVTTVDDAALDRAVESLETSLSQAPVDGAIVFVDGSAQATDAADGWALDAEGAADAVAAEWLEAAQPIELPTTTVEPAITQAETDAALHDVAEPLVDAPISVTVEGELAVLQPSDVSAAASMQPEDGSLVLHLDGEALADEVVSQLPDGTLKTAADAHFGFKDDKPVLVPGRVGTTVDPDDLAKALGKASTAQDRTAAVAVTETDPENTSEAMKKLGVKEVVSEFSTPLTSEPQRTINITQGLENITGVLVRPGETFSLTEALGPLDAAHGFVQAGAIVNGEHTDAWGGGLSQVSTTTFNAAYFAGMEDVEHTPHSEWFSRYPEGREATIFTGVLDMRWKNTTPYGALLQGWVADGRAYVRIWSTKYFTVESTTSGRSGVVQPTTVYSDSDTCSPQSAGNPGFTVTVTRELYLKGDLQETTSKTWRYRPQNAVVCGDPPSSEDEES
ncbi:VanW family protein [Cellulomonas sp. DKR-3]|uniref:VanW family protein n=1 Tax=Cellulomonas fulva TaxID=2835530 RepID=A0ABS5TUI4_9CELL|nr:VanW family protein [Cellulomonas fulva]MBT0992800.1 VanW family protein [Cellulomonas fulva]